MPSESAASSTATGEVGDARRSGPGPGRRRRTPRTDSTQDTGSDRYHGRWTASGQPPVARRQRVRARPCPRSSSCRHRRALARELGQQVVVRAGDGERVGVGAVEQLVAAPLADDGAGVARRRPAPRSRRRAVPAPTRRPGPRTSRGRAGPRAAPAPSRPAPRGRMRPKHPGDEHGERGLLADARRPRRGPRRCARPMGSSWAQIRWTAVTAASGRPSRRSAVPNATGSAGRGQAEVDRETEVGAAGLLLERQHARRRPERPACVAPCTSKVRTTPSRSASSATRRSSAGLHAQRGAHDREAEPRGRPPAAAGCPRRPRRRSSGGRTGGTGRCRRPGRPGSGRGGRRRRGRRARRRRRPSGKPRQAWWPMTSRAGPQPASATRCRIDVALSPARQSGVREKSVVPYWMVGHGSSSRRSGCVGDC